MFAELTSTMSSAVIRVSTALNDFHLRSQNFVATRLMSCHPAFGDPPFQTYYNHNIIIYIYTVFVGICTRMFILLLLTE